MSKAQNDVVITGIGIVTCQGVGKDAHVALLTADKAPPTIVETEKFKPYPVHPLPEIDWSQQIPKRGDQRQMNSRTPDTALDFRGQISRRDTCANSRLFQVEQAVPWKARLT